MMRSLIEVMKMLRRKGLRGKIMAKWVMVLLVGFWPFLGFAEQEGSVLLLEELAKLDKEEAAAGPQEESDAAAEPQAESVEDSDAAAEPQEDSDAAAEPQEDSDAAAEPQEDSVEESDAAAEPQAEGVEDAADGSKKSASAKRVGAYKIRFGASSPTFSGKLNYYDDLYGNPAPSVAIKVDHYFLGETIPFGIGLHAGYSQDTGKAALTDQPSGGSFSDGELDGEQELVLVLIPIQLNLVAQWPLFEKFITLDFWGGFEYLYVQESRHTSGGSSKSKTFVNTGYNQASVFGGGVNIRIDGLESRSQWALRDFGIQGVYLMPYVELANSISSKMGDYSRTTLGLVFSFETF